MLLGTGLQKFIETTVRKMVLKPPIALPIKGLRRNDAAMKNKCRYQQVPTPFPHNAT
jgi:hypothetical protein